MNCIKLPPGVEYIIDTLNSHGFEAVIVGGCVRDVILGLVPKDWDLATDALPEQVKDIFPRTYDTGIQHGTVTIVLDKENIYEITTFRTESGYSDYRRPDAVFYTKSLDEDLKRRDFTMNAVAYHPEKGFIDPFGGRADISGGIIRGVGCPEERFHEDALRMLRAVRFAGQLGFEIEPVTWEAVRRNSPLIVHVSAERVRVEFEKLILSSRPQKILLLNESKLLLHFYPILGEHLQEHKEIPQRLSSACPQLTPRLALILEEATEGKRILTDLRFDNKTIKDVLILIWGLRQETPDTPYGIRKQLAYMGKDAYEQLIALKSACGEPLQGVEALEKLYLSVLENKPCLSVKELAVNGEDLKLIGYQKGEVMGRALNILLEAVLEAPERNTREILLELAKKLR